MSWVTRGWQGLRAWRERRRSARPATVDQLEQWLAGPEPQRARSAALELATRGRPALAVLGRLVGHWDSPVRELAATAVAAMGPLAAEVRAELFAAFDPDRRSAAGWETRPEELIALSRALARAGSVEAVPALGKLVESGLSEVAVAAADALGELGAPAAAAVPALSHRLAAELGQSIVGAKIAVAHALGRIATPEAVATLRQVAFEARFAPDRALAAAAAARAGSAAVPFLGELLATHPDPGTRAAAAEALGATSAKEAIAPLAHALRADDLEEAQRATLIAARKRLERDVAVQGRLRDAERAAG